uniref:Uncharacterized protein n=1 Tax=Branchiostoma floridae TaxID=7739 RepID=C3YTK6_BRAFL|eukprot:XP_002600121.1 hypothetical protein BRAFLDRAFT_66630 [Branchiostoma floridae]
MCDINMTSLANKLQDLELCLKSQRGKQIGYWHALREAIISEEPCMETEVLKSLGDLHLQKGELGKDLSELDKAAALYSAALKCCTDPDMGQTLEHRISYMEKLSKQLLQGYTPQCHTSSKNVPNTTNVLRVAYACDKMESIIKKSWRSFEDIYTEAFVSAIEKDDRLMELEILKLFGDSYLEKGEKNGDLSQFSKAAAMYSKALRRCEDPDTKQTLCHRVLYMVKIWGVVRRGTSPRKSTQGENRPHTEHQLGNITSTDIIEDRLLHPDMHVPSNDKASAPGIFASITPGIAAEERLKDKQYKDHMKKGEASLGWADLDSAEQHFASALKVVHVREPTAQQYQREVEPLCKLGEVYSKRGQQTGDRGDFVKAAALYNSAITRSNNKVLNGNNHIATAVTDVEMSFLKCILHVDIPNMSQDFTEKHKKQLKEMRDQIKLEMETIDQQLDPYAHNEDDPCVKEIEAKRAQAVRYLFERIAQQRKEFISLLVEECIGLTGPPPCTYALIGLGSQATGLVTPYSDLEFAILVKEESEKCLTYFRKLTHYLHLKVVNLGETILPAVGIKCLNDFYSKNPLDNWYYDSVTPRGFAFDGCMPKASKTPLGRQHAMNEPPSELICSPENMVSLLQNDATLYLKEGYHLASILRNPCLITGDQDLTDTYMAITGEILQADGGKMAQQLAQTTLKENIKIRNNEETITARLIDVKKDLYRFPTVAVDCLALSSGIIPTTIWKTIEDMEKQQVISPNNAHHLTVLASISAELRLRTYIANGGQKENLSALASMETRMHGQESFLQTNDEIQTTVLKPVFHLLNGKQLFRYYYTELPLKNVLTEGFGQRPVLNYAIPEFYDDSLKVRGMMHYELCQYAFAISYFEKALMKANLSNMEKIELLKDIHDAYFMMGDYNKAISYSERELQMSKTIGLNIYEVNARFLGRFGNDFAYSGNDRKAVSYYEQALQMFRSVYGESKAHPRIATLLNNLGQSLHFLGDYKKAMSCFEEAQHMYRSIFGQTTAHPNIAMVLRNMGMTWHQLNDYKKTISFHEHALQMYQSIYGHSTAHPEISTSLNNLGTAWNSLGDHRKAISYCEQSLQMNRSIYVCGQTIAHPNIATSLNVIGGAWHELGDYKKAISYYEQALQMRKSIYGESKAHPQIAASFYNLGQAWNDLGDHRKATSYIEQALQIQRIIYGQSAAHHKIATSLNNMGCAWGNLGDHKKAINYHEQALQMQRNMYGKNLSHSEITTSLNNLGSAWSNLGNASKATGYYEQALQMCKHIYGQTTAHPRTASSLDNLGTAWHKMGDHRKAIKYHEQALQMFRCIYGKNTEHPRIATTLNNVAVNYGSLGNHRKAINYIEQALQMFRDIYGQTAEHPAIAGSLDNLGTVWHEMGDHRKAIKYHEQALQMARDVYGQGAVHPNIAYSLNNVALNYASLGDHRKAINYIEQALKMFRNIYGQTAVHPAMATSLSNLGASWRVLGDHRKALSYNEQALQMFQNIHGLSKVHPEIVHSLFNLALAWCKLSDQ